MKVFKVKRSTLSRYIGDTLAGVVIAILIIVWVALMVAVAAAPWVLVLFVAHWLGAF